MRHPQASSRPSRRCLALLAAVAVVTSAACGSTVLQETQYVRGGDGLSGDGAGGIDGGSGPGGAAGGTAGGPGGAQGGTAGAGRTGSVTASTALRGQARTIPKGGNLDIGIAYISDSSNRAFASAGATGTILDMRKAYQVVIDELNARGGIMGRRVVPHFRAFDVYGDGPSQEQAMCDFFTGDRKVYAVLGYFRHTDVFYSCLEKAGVIYFQSGGGQVLADSKSFREFRHAAVAGSLELSRFARAYVDELVAMGFFEGRKNIGIFGTDSPVYRRVIQNDLLPALARHGLSVRQEHIGLTKHTQSTSDLGEAGPQTALIVNKFQTDDVNRILLLAIPYAFMRPAESQTYRPRYGISTLASPEWLADNAELVPPPQLLDSMGIGWSPFADVTKADDDVPRPIIDRCYTLLKSKGMNPDADRLRELSAVSTCDNVWAFEAAMKAGGEPITSETFIPGLEKVGNSMVLGTTPNLNWGPGRHDGVSAVRHLRFTPDCGGGRGCYRYSSPPKPIS